MANGYSVAAYYFPNWHKDEINEKHHGRGWTEWNVLKCAMPRFEGHNQPKVPLWGYEDEADPAVFEKKIAAAKEYGVDCFLFDWYWFENKPFLQTCLEKGFFGAKNSGKIKFALMFANHRHWDNNMPARANTPAEHLLDGFVDEKTFVSATDYCIEKYFSHPSYWRVDGKLYFSVYELSTLIDGLGGVENTRRVLEDFRKRVRNAGLGELHINAILFNVKVLQCENILLSPEKQLEFLSLDSATSYVWVHHKGLDFPKQDYGKMKEKVFADFEKNQKTLTVPYYPNATMGWDPSPRTVQSDIFAHGPYPFTGIMEISPRQFEDQLQGIKDYLAPRAEKDRILTVNAWNEWTEGSYLEPDTVNGFAYLEKIKKVFGTDND